CSPFATSGSFPRAGPGQRAPARLTGTHSVMRVSCSCRKRAHNSSRPSLRLKGGTQDRVRGADQKGSRMLIEEIRTLSGPNVYHHKPMLVMRLQLQDLSATTTAEHPEFVERLLRLLPGLTEHHCAKGRPGGFVERLMEGTFFGHVVEHVAIELESLNGSAATPGKTRGAGEPGAYFVAVRFASEQGMRHLLRQAVALVEALLRGEAFDLAPVHER